MGQEGGMKPPESEAETLAATLIFRRVEHRVAAGGPLGEALEACGLAPELMIAVRDGQVIDHETQVRPGDRIRLIATIAGG